MNVTKLAAAVAAAAITFGVGAVNIAPASAADNIKTFGEQERLNNPNGLPYIGYTVFALDKSNAPVPHNGQLYSAKLVIDGFGGNTDPMIGRFGARTEKGILYPAIWGASNGSVLYFDVTGPVPNSVVWNDGVRDILAWIPGETPLEPKSVRDEPADPVPPVYDPYAPGGPAAPPATTDGMPAESSGNLGEATPDVIAPAPFELTEGEVASPGFHG
ncbi:MAG: MPT63 family protein [Mycobacterium sp.]|nr:MPT63 family protein [Mycobacterium sp.]